jgi:citrate lyase subunit beta/citryl-CoA lyase
MQQFRRRRACLTVPGASEKMVAKALAIAADEIVFDLEDGVAAAEKHVARQRVVAALNRDGYAAPWLSVRINAAGTPWCHEDVIAIASAVVRPVSLVLPKVDNPGDLAFLDRLLAGLELEHPRSWPIHVQALIETAAGLMHVAAIAGASPRLEALVIGFADLAASLGRRGDGGDWRHARESVLVASRAHGLAALDGPAFGIAADAALDASAREAAAMGFDGKWAIHPAQIGPINAAFTPSAADVEAAWALLARLDALEAAGTGAGRHQAMMIDAAMRGGAMRTLAMAGEALPGISP